MNKYNLAVGLIIISLYSCQDKGGSKGSSGSNPVGIAPAEETITDELTSDEENQNEETDSQVSSSKFNFNLFDGKCFNENGEMGLNPNEFGECGDLSEQSLSGLDFSKKNYWNLNLSGSLIEDSKVRVGKIAKYEVDFDENTVFSDNKNFFTQLFIQHNRNVNSQKRQIEKSSVKVDKYKEELQTLMSQYDDAATDKQRKKLEKKILKKKVQLEKFKSKAQVAMNKMYRHKDYSQKSYDLASDEPKMQNPKIKNKKWLSLSSKEDSINIGSFSESIGKGNFTLSFWFRSEEIQNSEGRIINALYSGNNSSLIFGVQKSNVFFGYRDEDMKYIRSNYEYDYADDQWHNVIISFHDNVFNVLLDGEKLASIEDSFIGFGLEQMSLGSYQLKQHVFLGGIDEVSLWNQSMNEADMSEIFNEGVFSNLKLHPQRNQLIEWIRLGDKVPNI